MKDKNLYLTKSAFKVASECPSKLYYQRNKSAYANKNDNDSFLKALSYDGLQVGELAKYYFPDGHNIISKGHDRPLTETNKLLKQENVILYEPAILFEDFFIRVDILVKIGNKIKLIEVKAKSFRSKKNFMSSKGFIKSDWLPYLNDISFQNWVAKKAFPKWDITPFLMLVDKNKKSSVDNLNQLFPIAKNGQVNNISDITKYILGDEILTKINVSKEVKIILEGKNISQNNKPVEEKMSFSKRVRTYSDYYKKNIRYPVTLGLKCKKCEFNNYNEPDLKSGFEECWKSIYPNFDVKKPHIFDIANLRNSEKFISQKLIYQKDLLESTQSEKLKPRQILQIKKTVNNSVEEDINPKLFLELDKFQFPLHFIDFETSSVAIPFYKNRHPFEQVAFQFSCHTLHKDRQIDHSEYIKKGRGQFPNYDFVKEMKSILKDQGGTIFRYGAHENTVLRQIQNQMINENDTIYSEYIEWIDTITQRRDEKKNLIKGDHSMIDLLGLIQKYYYHPKMNGDNSIKSVLPAIFSTSNYIKETYSKPLIFGTHLRGHILYNIDANSELKDPYKTLPDKYSKLNVKKDELLLDDGNVQNGGAALVAFGKLQFKEIKKEERDAIITSLLQYCELDTLAMLMIYEHWNSVR